MPAEQLELTEADRLMTVEEVSKILRVSTRSVRNWINAGRLPAIALPDRQHRLRYGDVVALVRSNKYLGIQQKFQGC